MAPSPLSRAISAYRRLELTRPHRQPVRQVHTKRVLQLNATQLVRLMEGYQSGATVYELAAEFGIERKTVALRLKMAGVTMRGQGPTSGDIEQMVMLYTSGLSLARVGEQLGFDARTVHDHIKRSGVPTRDTHGRDRF